MRAEALLELAAEPLVSVEFLRSRRDCSGGEGHSDGRHQPRFDRGTRRRGGLLYGSRAFRENRIFARFHFGEIARSREPRWSLAPVNKPDRPAPLLQAERGRESSE